MIASLKGLIFRVNNDTSLATECGPVVLAAMAGEHIQFNFLKLMIPIIPFLFLCYRWEEWP